MRFLFIQDTIFDWPGTMSLSAYAKAQGHEVDIVCSQDAKTVLGEVDRFKPGLVGFNTITGQHHYAKDMAKRVKEAFPEVRTIAGGPHATFFPQIVQEPQFDFVGVNEFEYPLGMLLERLDKGAQTDDIPGLYCKGDDGQMIANPPSLFPTDLDALPDMDRELYLKYTGKVSNVFFVGRGCPYKCSFCFNHQSHKQFGDNRSVRWRSARRVIDEIKAVRDKYGLEKVRFQDDTFTLNKRYTQAFLTLYKEEIGLPYGANFRAEHMTRDLARLLKDSGADYVAASLETADEEMRFKVLKKTVPGRKYHEAARNLKEVGLNFGIGNMLGLPGETLEQGFQTIEMNIEMGATMPWFSIFQPYPSTSLAQYTQELYNLDPIDADDFVCPDYHSNSLLPGKEAKQLSNLHKFAVWMVKYPVITPLVRVLVKLPPNPIFTLIHRVSHLFTFAAYNDGDLWKTLKLGLSFEFAKLKTSLMTKHFGKASGT
ncbi:MAG: B12-binding domain-containing radical SAM protein [Magnetococcales bacterium]|nr:B12-binding domain-containing radical SAM protein [Magnetococcales bacterium]